MLQKRSYEAQQYIEKLKSGKFQKNHLPNHGVNFTGDYEQLAHDAFVQYQTSCGRHLLHMRLKREGNKYVG